MNREEEMLRLHKGNRGNSLEEKKGRLLFGGSREGKKGSSLGGPGHVWRGKGRKSDRSRSGGGRGGRGNRSEEEKRKKKTDDSGKGRGGW